MIIKPNSLRILADMALKTGAEFDWKKTPILETEGAIASDGVASTV